MKETKIKEGNREQKTTTTTESAVAPLCLPFFCTLPLGGAFFFFDSHQLIMNERKTQDEEKSGKRERDGAENYERQQKKQATWPSSFKHRSFIEVYTFLLKGERRTFPACGFFFFRV
jgi:hypothetical protein